MANEKRDVCFPAVMSNESNCICAACHGLGQVMKVRLPETKYRWDGKPVLTTAYNNYWLCRNCRERLVYSLTWGCDDEAD